MRLVCGDTALEKRSFLAAAGVLYRRRLSAWIHPKPRGDDEGGKVAELKSGKLEAAKTQGGQEQKAAKEASVASHTKVEEVVRVEEEELHDIAATPSVSKVMFATSRVPLQVVWCQVQ